VKIRIKVSLPPKQLRPNYGIHGRGSKYAISKAANLYRREAAIAARGPAVARERLPLERFTVRYIAYWPSRRNFIDPDNLVGSMKRALDGIKKAGVILDDNATRMTLLTPEQHKATDDYPAGVVIEITEATDE
jgi:Holliday junction resolvase RusA-like endonuclease